jgi:phosphohistidine swiveling domain-containing protein
MMSHNHQDPIKPRIYTVELRNVSRKDAERVGAKAANLGELMQAGLPVPDGFVVTTDAFAEFLMFNGLDTDASQEKVKAASVPADIAEAVLKSSADLGDAPVAVRSSGVGEDLLGASFAGQYETFLDVRGDEALLDALRGCWASAFNERVIAYRKSRGQQESGMAVLIQLLVQADAAGVAFTANPVTGDRSEVVVSSVHGLGDRLVSGRTSPDEWRVRGNDVSCERAPEKAISSDQVRAVAEMARRVEAHCGSPQDIEWAIANGQLFLLQARPITALPEETLAPIPVPVKPPPGFWQRKKTHVHEPIWPMYRSVFMESANAGFKYGCSELSLPSEGLELRDIGGWEYCGVVSLGGKEPPRLPTWLLSILVRIEPLMRSRIKGSIELLKNYKEVPFIQLWFKEWKPAQTTRIAELRSVDLPGLTDTALDDHISLVLMPFFKESLRCHFLLQCVFGLALGRLVFTCQELQGWDNKQIMELLSGLSESSSEPARRLSELASLAAERPAIRALLEQMDDSTVNRLAEVDPEFARAFDAYQHESGCQVLRHTFCDPTLAERPLLVLRLVRDQIARGFNPKAIHSDLEKNRAATMAKARALLANRPAKDKERFEKDLEGAVMAYPIKEESEFYNIDAPMGLMRYALLELGHRLVRRRQIMHRDDIFFLELEEVLSAFRQGKDLRNLVARRKAERAWVEAHPGPPSYGRDLPPPLAAFPSEVQIIIKIYMWVTESLFNLGQAGKRDTMGKGLEGIPASPGRYTGPARVIMGESEFGKLQVGDVMVCPCTTAVWSILFPSIGALITDSGGTLSHPAIIAREYKVPAVVATGNATHLLKDGQIVTVDGSAGTVEVRV